MFLVNGEKKFLLDFDSFQFPYNNDNSDENQQLKIRLVIIDKENKFETVLPIMTIDELYNLSRWFLSVVERPFKELDKISFYNDKLCFEYFPEKYDMENLGQYLKISFCNELNPLSQEEYIIEGAFPRAQLNIALNHLKKDYSVAHLRVINDGDTEPLERHDAERRFREFLFYNYENPKYEYLRDHFFIVNLEKNISSIISSYYMLEDADGNDKLTFISVVASQRTNLFEENLLVLLDIAAIPHPGWNMIYDILGRTAVYYGLSTAVIEIYSQAIKTAQKQKNEALYSSYSKLKETAKTEYQQLAEQFLFSAAISGMTADLEHALSFADKIAEKITEKADRTEIKGVISEVGKEAVAAGKKEACPMIRLSPLVFYLYSKYGIKAFDNPEAYYLVHKASVSGEKDILSLAACDVFCAIMIQLIFGNPLFDDTLIKIKKQILKFAAIQKNAEYSAALQYFENVFSEDFYNLPKEKLGIVNSGDDNNGAEKSKAENAAAVLKAAVWCNLNAQSFEDCLEKARELDPSVVPVAAEIAFLIYKTYSESEMMGQGEAQSDSGKIPGLEEKDRQRIEDIGKKFAKKITEIIK